MLRIFAAAYMELCSSLSRLETLVENLTDEQKRAMVNGDFAEAPMLRRAHAACSALDLEVALKQVVKIKSAIEGGITNSDFGLMLRELRSRIQDESETKLVLHVPREHAKYFEAQKLFGESVAKNFPNCTKDIEEAGLCLGCSRGTATVFHLMRIMEDGLKHIAARLGIPYAPSWESYIKQIGDQIVQKHEHKSVKWKRDEPFFREVLGDLIAVKTAWRNPTMHIVRHYDFDEAEDIFRAVRRFMERLATETDKAIPQEQQLETRL